jgi:hypothetical protein
MVIWKQSTGIAPALHAWAGQVMDGEQPAVIDKPGGHGVPWKYTRPRLAPPGELSVLVDMLLSDWRAAEAHVT